MQSGICYVVSLWSCRKPRNTARTPQLDVAAESRIAEGFENNELLERVISPSSITFDKTSKD